METPHKTVYSFKGAVVSRVNGDLWDLSRPLVEDCELQLLGFDSLEGKQVQAFVFKSFLLNGETHKIMFV